MVWVCVGCVVQNHRLGEVPPQNAEIFDVVAKNTGTVVLIEAMSTKETMLETFTPVSVSQVCQCVVRRCVRLLLSNNLVTQSSTTALLAQA